MRLFAFALLAPLLLADPQAGKVISAGKGWQTASGLATRNQTIDAKATLKGGSKEAELILECKRGWVQYVCSARSCEFPPCILQAESSKYKGSVAVKELGLWDRALLALTTREPKEVVTLGVRAGGNPSDAPLLQDAKGVHFAPALNRVLEGKYCLRLTPLPSGATRTLTVDWDRAVDPEGAVAAPNLAPGVYVLDKGTPSGTFCTLDPDAVAAWVAILPQNRFAAASATWKTESPRITQIERSDAGPAAAAILRHAVIASLFDSPAPAK